MRAVKLDKHTGFADENDMYSYFVSAKSGDNVASAFHRIAADWAGVVLTKPEMEIAAVRSPLPSPQQRWPELSTVGCVVRRSRWWRALSTTRGTPSCRRGTGQTRGRAAAPCNDGGAGGFGSAGMRYVPGCGGCCCRFRSGVELIYFWQQHPLAWIISTTRCGVSSGPSHKPPRALSSSQHRRAHTCCA